MAEAGTGQRQAGVQHDIAFGRFVLRRATRELLEGGRPVRLGKRAFDLLLALVEAGGRPVPREALFERAWPGRVVLDDNLKVQMMAVRQAIGRDAVVTVPGRGYRFGWPVRAAGAPADTPDLFGRDDDLSRLVTRLAPGSIATVVGAGGIGKTRLAQAAAGAAAGAFADGAVFVELAALVDGRMVPGTVARAWGMPPGSTDEALLAALRPSSLLVVLDNAEHVLGSVCTFVAAVVAAAPGVAVLVTSQEALGLEGETVLRLDGLAPDAAAALFRARVRTSEAGYTPGRAGEGDAEAIDRICQRLDGIPLALELAARRVPLLGVAGVEHQLDAALGLLSRGARDVPPRHQTLRGALQWSHALLDDVQKVVFRRLAVFAGSFAPEDAAAVAADTEVDRWAALDALQSLVDKSLLQRDGGTQTPRLRLPEAARQFAAERLVDAGEAPPTRRRHAETMAMRFEAADERYTSVPALPWLQALLPDLPNLRAAVAWALGVDGDDLLAIRLCGAAGGFWAMTGQHAESGPAMKQLAQRIDARVRPEVQARFWLAVANRGSDHPFTWAEAADACDRAVALARESGQAMLLHRALGHGVSLAHRLGRPVDPGAVADEMRMLEGRDWSTLQRRSRRTTESFAVMLRGDWARYAELERQELHLLREAGDTYRAWFAAHRVALAELSGGNADEAVVLMQTAVDEIRRADLLRHAWQQVALLAVAMIETGRAPAAPVHEAVRLMRGAGAMAWMACHLAEWLTQQGRHADAARLLGWVGRCHRERGESPTAQGEQARARALAAIAAVATPAHAARWQAEGERWDDDAAAQAVLR